MQHGQHDLDSRLLLGRDDVHGDTAAVVDDAYATVRKNRHVDGVRVPGQRLVDGVVDDLVDEVVKAALTGRADVHAGPLADRVQTLEDCDGAGVVRRGHLAGGLIRLRGGLADGVGGSGRDVLVGVAGIGHEAPFLAQHKPSPAVAGAAASFSDSQRCSVCPTSGAGLTLSLPVALTVMGVCRYLSPHVPP